MALNSSATQLGNEIPDHGSHSPSTPRSHVRTNSVNINTSNHAERRITLPFLFSIGIENMMEAPETISYLKKTPFAQLDHFKHEIAGGYRYTKHLH